MKGSIPAPSVVRVLRLGKSIFTYSEPSGSARCSQALDLGPRRWGGGRFRRRHSGMDRREREFAGVHVTPHVVCTPRKGRSQPR